MHQTYTPEGIKEAPKFIDKYISTEIPTEDELMCKRVSARKSKSDDELFCKNVVQLLLDLLSLMWISRFVAMQRYGLVKMEGPLVYIRQTLNHLRRNQHCCKN
jgi:hypothetical protein